MGNTPTLIRAPKETYATLLASATAQKLHTLRGLRASSRLPQGAEVLSNANSIEELIHSTKGVYPRQKTRIAFNLVLRLGNYKGCQMQGRKLLQP